MNPGSALPPIEAINELLVMSFPFGALHCPTLADLEAEMHCNCPILPVEVVVTMLLFWIRPVPSRYSAVPKKGRKSFCHSV